MANPKIKVKRSSVAGKVPAPTQLERGELAVNSYDGKVYIIRDQFSTGIGTTTHTLNPWDEYTIGNKIAYAGIASAQQFDGNLTGSINSSGISTFGGNISAAGNITADGNITIDNINKSLRVGNVSSDNYADLRQISASSYKGFTFQHSNASVLANLQGTTNQYLVLGDNDSANSGTIFGISNDQGGTVSTRLSLSGSGNLDVHNNITLGGTVDGRDVATDGSKLDNIESNATRDQTASEIVSLLSDQNITTSGTISVTGDLTAASDFTLAGDATVQGDLYLSDTGTNSSAGPIIDLYRNSSSAADADYLGQIKFQGENDADQKNVYAKITGKIQDASDGTEDGLIEFANKKAGSNVITARLRSDSLQLLNGTNFSVAGTSNFTGNVTCNGSFTIGDYSLPTSIGAEGLVLKVDGSGNLVFGSGSSGGVVPTEQVFTASQGQTVFTASSALPTYVQVFVNGVKLRPTSDFSKSGSSVTLVSAATAGDEIDIVRFD